MAIAIRFSLSLCFVFCFLPFAVSYFLDWKRCFCTASSPPNTLADLPAHTRRSASVPHLSVPPHEPPPHYHPM